MEDRLGIQRQEDVDEESVCAFGEVYRRSIVATKKSQVSADPEEMTQNGMFLDGMDQTYYEDYTAAAS